MIQPGLVSVTFRQLIAREIVRLAHHTGIKGIEWGGDVHVPPGDLDNAKEVRAITEETGLVVVSYGSYYRAGIPHANESPFPEILETAIALGAPGIRVWSGVVGSERTDETMFRSIVVDIQRIAHEASQAGLEIYLEYHRGTYCDTAKSALQLRRSVNRENVLLYWQPDPTISQAERVKGLDQLVTFVSNVHVFQWESANNLMVRHPLNDGRAEWTHYLDILNDLDRESYALLEFVEEDSPDRFVADAKVLKKWLNSLRPSV